MDFDDIIYASQDAIAMVTINRPDCRNAVSPKTCIELAEVFNKIDQNDAIKALIITGAGKAFCAGGDLAQWEAQSSWARKTAGREIRYEGMETAGLMIKSLSRLKIPIIAAVNGDAMGAGFSLALNCDLRIISEKARFQSSFVARAVSPDTGLTFLLPRIVGTSKALEIMWLAEVIDAKLAYQLGLANKLVTHNELIPTALEIAGKIVNGPTIAIEMTKKLVYEGLKSNNYHAQLGLEAWGLVTCTMTDDFKESLKAFFEKRTPNYQGL